MKKAGRPSEFKEEYIEKAQEYLDTCVDTAPYRDKEGQLKDRKVKIPTIEGFALYLGVAKSSLYLWEKESEEFSDALDKIVNEQKQRLIDSGLAGTYNSTIAKLILSSNHGMRERNDLTTDGKEMPQPIISVSRNDSD